MAAQGKTGGRLEAIPWVVLTGRPNVGKSTLFKALLGRSRAMTSATAGTTRDVLCEPLGLHSEPGRVTLRICDDGQGFDPEGVQPERLGLRIMHERAQAIGATFSVKSQPAQGTEVTVVWPDGEDN